MKRFGILLSLLSFFYLLVMPSQAIADKFAKTFGDTLNQSGRSVHQTSDGGYIVAGSGPLSYAGDYDFLVLKLSSAGATEWLKAYGTTGHDVIHGWSKTVQQTSDGGYIVAGCTDTASAGYNGCLVIKLNSAGGIGWARTYYSSGIEQAYSVQQTSDGGYILGGGTGAWYMITDFLVLKLSSAGAVQWARTYGSASYTNLKSVQQTSDSGYIVIGNTPAYGAGSYDFLVLKLSSAGDLEWAKTYGGSGADDPYSVQQTSDGGYVVAGYTMSYGVGNADFLVLKLSSAGDLEWAKTYGGSGVDDPYSIRQTSDGGYIVAGITTSYGAGNYDVLLIKLGSAGDLSWAKTFGGTDDEYAYSIEQTLDSGYVVAGYTQSYGTGDNDFLAIKLESDGIYDSCFYDCSPTVDDCSPDTSSPSVGANWTPTTGSLNLSVTNLSYPLDDVCPPDTGVMVEENVESEIPGSLYLDIIPSVGKNNFSIKYGIPKSVDVSNEPTLSLKLYDATGRLEKVLLEKNIRCWCQAGSYTRSLDLSELQSGVYFLRLEVGNKYSVKKAILLR
jgi:uncharacterized delta-60 repeat protein